MACQLSISLLIQWPSKKELSLSTFFLADKQNIAKMDFIFISLLNQVTKLEQHQLIVGFHLALNRVKFLALISDVRVSHIEYLVSITSKINTDLINFVDKIRPTTSRRTLYYGFS